MRSPESKSEPGGRRSPRRLSGPFSLRNPEKMNGVFGYKVPPIEGDVTALKEGDIIDLNGLELKVFDFFGHTQDCIAILDESNKNLFK